MNMVPGADSDQSGRILEGEGAERGSSLCTLEGTHALEFLPFNSG
jgi:hypothetical protein